MGLRVTLPYPSMYQDERDEGGLDVILHTKQKGLNGLEIVDFDLEHALAAAVFFIEDHDPELFFYRNYEKGGLDSFIWRYPEELYAAFQEQGYDVFEDESYDSSEFLNTVGQNIRENIGRIEENIEVLKEAIERKEYERDEFIDDLVEALKTLADPLLMPERPHGNEQIILNLLLYMLPTEKFAFTHDDPWSGYEGADRKDWHWRHNIEINGEVIVSWDTPVDMVISSPKKFSAIALAPHKDRPEIGSPYIVRSIMDRMGWKYPKIPEEIDGPDYPESDDDGLFGVEYIEYSYNKEKRTFIRYKTLIDAVEAAELSQDMMRARGLLQDYMITVLIYDEEADEWLPTDAWE